MADHVTNVMEFREAGLLLRARGTHSVRVMGALKEIPILPDSGAKEDIRIAADFSLFERYYSGELSSPQEDPSAQPFHPQVPALFITREGEFVFLERDWSESEGDGSGA
ncbi:MAG: hypothetical protein L0229_09455 [Blastocatellia bacterium]|nr:hypothetical protein [Blastocatellia bacterium]